MENSVDHANNFSEIVDNLVNLFGTVMNKDVIAAVVESCDGDLHLSVDAIMNMTEDGNKIENNNEDTATHTIAAPPVTASEPVPPSFSYASTVQTAPSIPNTGAIPKQVCRPLKANINFWTDQIRGIIANHNKGCRILIIMRGLPGSGKTHLARQLVEMMIGATINDYNNHIFSTDDYFMVRGQYQYNRYKLSEAHIWNQNRVMQATSKGVSPIIVDNTNVEIWEMETYLRDGIRNGYIIELVEANTPWAKKPNQLLKKSIHEVPLATIKKKLDMFQGGLTAENVIKGYGLSYPANMVPPIRRSIPVFSKEDEPIKLQSNDNCKENVNEVHTNVDQVPLSSIPNNTIENLEAVFDASSKENTADERDTNEERIESKENIANVTETNENLIEFASTQNNEDVEELSYEQQARERLYLEAQKRLEEMEKVVQDWENGENWEELQGEVSTVQNTKHSSESTVANIINVEPKPPRNDNPQDSSCITAESLMQSVNQCQDWTQISIFMPPWSDISKSSIEMAQESPITTVSSGTCMEINDTNSESGKNKVIVATPRNINEFRMTVPKEKIPVTRMLDKSTMTNEQALSEAFRCKNEEKHFIAFRKLFKNIARSDLRDIFDHCCGDVNWAVSIVLDGMVNRQLKQCDIDDLSDPEEESLEQCECLAAYNVIPDVSTSNTVNSETINQIKQPQPESVSQQNKKSKKDVTLSVETLQLKRQIEQNVVIHDSHYSEHCLKIRKFRRGEVDIEQASTSGSQETAQLGDNNDVANPADHETNTNSDDEVSIMSENEGEKTVTMTLGWEFIRELDTMFGRTDMEYPDNIGPKVSVPSHLMNELNALWMESFMYQLEKQAQQIAKIIKEDEQMARDLAIKEAELVLQGRQPVVPDFKEIMDLDLAVSLYQKDVAEWRNKEPNDLAAKLSREKLYNLFPDVEKDVLSELLMAHDNNFQSTVEVLLVSTGKTDILETENGMNKFIMDKELERQEKLLEEQTKMLSEEDWPMLPQGEEVDMDIVNGYRSQAEEHLTRRNFNYQKAQSYIQRGMTQVAAYYSELASFHKRKFEQANSLAAASLIQLHSKQSSEATVDLHYLRVNEAKESLDLFLDTHIQKLRESNGQQKNILYFITGRGLHSPGRPRVKPAVKKRLNERGIRFTECNPGLLSAKIRAHDLLSYQIQVP